MPQLEEWLALIHTEQLGPVTLNKLLNSFGSVEAILNADRSKLLSAGTPTQVIKSLLEPNNEAIARDLEWLQHESHYLITIEDNVYPTQLRQISDAPIALYATSKQKHAIQMLSEPQLAIVGSRNASANGKQITTLFAQQLAQAGMIITSGLASGIDGAAHRGALQAPIGTTVAVAACGLDRVYPAEHKKLAEQIIQLKPEIVLLGTGIKLNLPDPKFIAYFAQQGIGFEAMSTDAACRTYGILTAEGRKTVAALILPEK